MKMIAQLWQSDEVMIVAVKHLWENFCGNGGFNYGKEIMHSKK